MLDYNPLSRHLNITNRENSNPSETQVQYCIHLRVVLTQAIFEINIGKRRIRHRTTLKLDF